MILTRASFRRRRIPFSRSNKFLLRSSLPEKVVSNGYQSDIIKKIHFRQRYNALTYSVLLFRYSMWKILLNQKYFLPLLSESCLCIGTCEWLQYRLHQPTPLKDSGVSNVNKILIDADINSIDADINSAKFFLCWANDIIFNVIKINDISLHNKRFHNMSYLCDSFCSWVFTDVLHTVTSSCYYLL